MTALLKKGLSQADVGKARGTSGAIIKCYERNEGRAQMFMAIVAQTQDYKVERGLFIASNLGFES